MSRNIDSAVRAILGALRVPRLSLAIEFPSIGTSGLLITNFPRNVTVASKTYTGAAGAHRFKIVGEGFSENLDFEAPSSVLKITNLDGYFAGLFNADSFRGKLVTVSILYVSVGGGISLTGWSTTFGCDADTCDDTVTLRLASSDVVVGAEVPNRTTQQWGCQSDYRNEGCGNRGPLTSCDHGYDTPNGCKAHWGPVTDPVTGLPVQQWKPYGGFLGNVDAQLVLGGVR